MKKILYILLTAAFITVASCEDKIDTWSGIDRIGFTVVNGEPDTLKTYSFVTEISEVTRHSVMLSVSTEGMLYDYPRTVTIKQVPSYDGDDAVAGVHYVAFGDGEVAGQYVIPAGTNTIDLPIILLRDESLQTSQKILRIELVPNDYFELSITGHRLYREIHFADMLTIPLIWGAKNFAEDVFGTYGQEKHRFMIDITGMAFNDEWFADNFYWYEDTYWGGVYTGWQPNDSDYLSFLQKWLQEKLDERNAAEGNILTESDGTVVDFFN